MFLIFIYAHSNIYYNNEELCNISMISIILFSFASGMANQWLNDLNFKILLKPI